MVESSLFHADNIINSLGMKYIIEITYYTTTSYPPNDSDIRKQKQNDEIQKKYVLHFL